MIHSIRVKKLSKMMVKLDIRRAYDEAKRDFLLKVLAKFGFTIKRISWVDYCISSTKGSLFSLMEVNKVFLKGIRQGDPLSPFLFIILAEVLGRLIGGNGDRGQWKGVKVVNGVEVVSP